MYLRLDRGPEFKKLIFLGVILGMASFWNGAVIIAAVIIITALALFLKRFDFLIIAILAVTLAYAQSYFFIGQDSPISPAFHWGFLSGMQDGGFLNYYLALFGILPLILLVVFFIITTRQKLWLLAFLGPFAFANLTQVTPDINMNHKFINISIMLLGIFAAYLLVKWPRKHFASNVVSFIALFFLTFSGVIDMFSLINFNSQKSTYALDHPLTVWAQENTDKKAVFLANSTEYHPVLWAGRNLFIGWPYFVHSAGYDYPKRYSVKRDIYSGQNTEEAVRLLQENNIDYIVVDPSIRPDNINNLLLNEGITKVFHDTKTGYWVYSIP